MTGKHYNWHKRWAFDMENASATHENGFVAMFLELPLSEEEKRNCDAEGICAIGQCWTDDEREFGIVTTSAILNKTFDALVEQHGEGNAQKMLARLSREAGEIFVYALKKSQKSKKIIDF